MIRCLKRAGAVLAAACVAFCTAQPAVADTVLGVHAVSVHSAGGFNNKNPGLYIQSNGWTAGAYYNSERKASVYAGYTWSAGRYSITVGGITGYGAAVQPLVVPSARFADPLLGGYWRVHYAAKVYSAGAHALHLSHEWSL